MATGQEKKVKISDLPESGSFNQLWTLGYQWIDGVKTSVKVSLQKIQEAYDNVVRATGLATTAATNADTATAAAKKATQDAVTATDNAKSVSDHPGYIGDDYHVYTWDYVTGAYNKTDTVLRPEGFSIFKTYATIAAMNADLTNVPEGKFVLINTNDVEQTDNAKLYVRGASSFEYLVDMSGAIGFTGKTPQITIGTVTSGQTSSATLSPNGTDSGGNPKFKLNLVIQQGEQGFTPVIESGTVTTGQPGSNASATLTPNGQTTDGRDKYRLDMTIPQGASGTGSGNILADVSQVATGKKYLFSPSADGSAEGTFVEYTEPSILEQVQPDWNATSGKGQILNKPTIPTKLSQLDNDNNTVTDANYVHTDNNYTTEEKEKLAGLNAGGSSDDYVITIATAAKQLFKAGAAAMTQATAETFLGPIEDLLSAVDAGKKIYIKNAEAKTLTELKILFRSSNFTSFSSQWALDASHIIDLHTVINSSKSVTNRGIRHGYLINLADTIIVGGGVQEQYSLSGDVTLTVTPDTFSPEFGCVTTVMLSTLASSAANVTIAADSALEGKFSVVGDNPITIPANSIVELSIMFTQAYQTKMYIARYSEPFTRPS